MKRSISLKNLGNWQNRSIELFNNTAYLDNISEIYPFKISSDRNLESELRRNIIRAHQSRNKTILFEILKSNKKFPYEDPIWYLLRNSKSSFEKNPMQVDRIANIIFSMTADEAIARLESPPKLNTQTGPMFRSWLINKFRSLPISEFESSTRGVFILDAGEEQGKQFLHHVLDESLSKRPDLICKVNSQYIIGEAKWVGQPGGNQEKQVQEVINFCKKQKGRVRRIGLVDGFPWATYNKKGKIVNNKEAIYIQESEFDIMSALLLKQYLKEFN